MRDLQEQVEKSATKYCSDLSLFEKIAVVISKFLQFLAFSLEFQKFFSITRTFYSQSKSEPFW